MYGVYSLRHNFTELRAFPKVFSSSRRGGPARQSEEFMKTILKSALVATLLAGSVGLASAATIGFNIGDVAIGYSDGYYDHGHHFHRWAHHDDMVAWQHDHGSDYHEWRHNDRHHH
jgi:hypothetical protein